MKRVRIEVELSGQAYQMLAKLVSSGLYGQTEAEAAERILCRDLESNMSAWDSDHQRWRCPASKDGIHFDGCGCE